MAKTQVQAARIARMTLRKPQDRPDLALLILQTKAGPQHYALTRDNLIKMANAFRKHADAMPGAEAGGSDPAA